MKIIECKKTKDAYVVKVDVDKKEWIQEQEKAIKFLAKEVKVPGFRKGNVPFDVASKKINPQDIFSRALDKIIKNVAKNVITTPEFKKIEDDILELPPSVDVAKLTKEELQLNFSYVLYPEVKIDGYKDIKPTVKMKSVTEQDIKTQLDNYLAKNAMTVPKENGWVAKEDIVTFDFKGFVDGQPFKGGEAKNYELTIGSGQFIPGFEDQMIGMSIGDKKDINVTFPKDYHEKKLAGKPAKFEVVVHSISVLEKAKMNDDFVKSLQIKNVETVEDLKKHIKENLSKTYKSEFEQQQKIEIYNSILKIVQIDNIPYSLVEKEKAKIISNTEQQMSMYGIKLDQYLKMMNISKEQFDKQQTDAAIKNLKISMAILKVCELEKIEATEKELQEEVEKTAKMYNMKKEDILKNVNNDLSIFESFVVERKVVDFFLSKK